MGELRYSSTYSKPQQYVLRGQLQDPAFTPRERAPRYQLNRRLDWLQSFGEEINLLLLSGIKLLLP